MMGDGGEDIEWREELVGTGVWVLYWVLFVLTGVMPAVFAFRMARRRIWARDHDEDGRRDAAKERGSRG